MSGRSGGTETLDNYASVSDKKVKTPVTPAGKIRNGSTLPPSANLLK